MAIGQDMVHRILAQMEVKVVGDKEAKRKLDELGKGGQVGMTSAEKVQKQLQKRESALNTQKNKAQRELLFTGLSLMFFMMALNKAIMGMIQPAGEMAGIFELMNLILALFFLPTMLALLPILLDLLDWVLSIDEGTRGLVGAFILFAGVLAGLMQWVAMISLGIPGVTGSIGMAIKLAEGLFGAFAKLGTLGIVALITSLALAFEKLDDVLRSIGEFLYQFFPEEKKTEIANSPLMTVPADIVNVVDDVLAIPGDVTKGVLGEGLGGFLQSIGEGLFRATPVGMGYTAMSTQISIMVNNAPGTSTDISQSSSDGTSSVPVNE